MRKLLKLKIYVNYGQLNATLSTRALNFPDTVNISLLTAQREKDYRHLTIPMEIMFTEVAREHFQESFFRSLLHISIYF